MLNEATKQNLRRKSAFVDEVQLHEGKPLFSWVDLSLTEMCNRSHGHPRACSFCPRIDPTFYPNQALHMSMELIGKIARELRELEYKGAVVLCGYGEPLLHPKILDVVRLLNADQKIRLEIVTNGDRLNPQLIKDLYGAGCNYLVVSMYDGPEQVEKFRTMFSAASAALDTDYILRDRWHTEADDFGLKLTNRAGTVGEGNQDAVDTHHPCYYLTYQLTVDWNGDVLLCVQDWHKKVKFGNVNGQTMLEIWRSTQLHKRRMKLIDGRREDSPCNGCNTDGTLHGHNHVPVWSKK